MGDKETSAGDVRARALRHLRELIEALDSRMPHSERTGESAITREAAKLRDKALNRIAELESET